MHKIKIDMEQLKFSFQDDSPDNLYYLDLETGEVRLVHRQLHELRDLTDEIETDRERFLFIPRPDPKKGKEDLRDFIDTVDDDRTKVLLDVAMESPHPLSGFKKILKDDASGTRQLNDFLEGRAALRLRQWLAANCIEVDV